jgi:hypothetical protein
MKSEGVPCDSLEWRLAEYALHGRRRTQGDERTDLPPYLLFLNRLFDELGADRIEAIKKAELEELIRERWPVAQFGPPSNNLIVPMATILRSLKAKRGGAKPQHCTVH